VVIVIFGILVFLGGNLLGIWKFGGSSSSETTEDETGIIVPDVTNMMPRR